MASFTDRIPQFNPYVSQQPVEAMVQVGMAKQQQYNTNLQKIQQSMSSIAGLPVSRDIDKKYLEQKMTDMTKNLQGYASSDLSSNRLTTHLRSMVGGIAQDEVVQNSVRSTMAVQSAKKLQAKYTEEGKGSPSNDYMLNRQLEQYYTNDKVGASFNGTYKPYQEYNEPAREIIKNLASDYTENDVAFNYDDNGNIIGVRDAITKTVIEGITPEKIQNALMAQLSPAMLEQMQIDGIYQYSGASDEQFISSTQKRYESVITNYQSKIGKLEKMALKSAPGVKEKINDQIDGIKEYIKGVKREFNSVNKQLESGNLDGAKAKLFTIDWMDNMAQSFSSSKISTTIETNPYMETHLKKAKMRQDNNIAYAKMQQTEYWKTIDAGFKRDANQLKRDELDLKRQELNGGEGSQGYGGITMPKSGEELDDVEYIAQVNESINEAQKTTKEQTEVILNRHNIDPEELETQMALAKDLSYPMSFDLRQDLNTLSKIREEETLKTNQFLKVESNAEKLHPTTADKILSVEDNKTYFAEFPDGTIYEYTTEDMLEFIQTWVKGKESGIEEALAIDYENDSPEIIELKKRQAPMYVAYKKRFGSGTTKFVIENENFTFYGEDGEPINKKTLALELANVDNRFKDNLKDNIELKNEYIASELKSRRAAFNPNGYPIPMKDAKAKADFKAGVINQLAIRAREGSLEGTNVDEDELLSYSNKLSGAVVSTDGQGNNQVTIFSDDKVGGLTVPLVDADFNQLFKGRYQMSPQQATYYNEYLPDLLDFVPEAIPLTDDSGIPMIDPDTNNIIYKENPNNFWTTSTTGSYESNIDEARYKKRDGFFNNVNLFDVSADVVSSKNPATAETVILKLNIQDPYTGKTYNSITFPSPVATSNIDTYLKQSFDDMSIWNMLPGNARKQMSQEEYEARKTALQTGEKN